MREQWSKKTKATKLMSRRVRGRWRGTSRFADVGGLVVRSGTWGKERMVKWSYRQERRGIRNN